MSDETLLSGQDWAINYEIVIHDPDGWRDSSPWGYCSLADLIGEREFWERVSMSTCTKFPEKARERLKALLIPEGVPDAERA